MTLSIKTICHYAQLCCAEWRILLIVMLNDIMLSVAAVNVVMLCCVDCHGTLTNLSFLHGAFSDC
jgi:hypothetical protein